MVAHNPNASSLPSSSQGNPSSQPGNPQTGIAQPVENTPGQTLSEHAPTDSAHAHAPTDGASDPSSNTGDMLQQLLNHLVVRVRREQLETWFRSLIVARADDTEVELSVTSQFVRDWLAKNFLAEMQAAIDSLGTPAGRRRLVLTHRAEDGQDSLRLVQTTPADEIERVMRNTAEARVRNIDGLPVPPQTRTTNSQSSTSQSNAPQHGVANGNVPAQPHQGQQGYQSYQNQQGQRGQNRQGQGRRIGNPLNPNYTFDRFVVGPCNRLAHASALAIGENPGHAYNPLFVHGNVGLGKSHLLQAICHTVLRRDPNARVLYMSCEDFTNSYIQAIQGHQIDNFRDYHRGADVLVIDDVQFLANKEKTQDEFFHTFNALFDGQRQIVLSSDRPPVEIPTIEERLVSRFKWGLVAEVEAPCVDTRKAIVSSKAAGRGVDLPDDVAQFLAERVTSNIRELEGAVIKVVGFAAITDQPISLSLAESCLRGMPMRRAQVTSEEVMALITGEFAITARELIGKSRTQAVSMPRQIAMFLLREHTESSLEDIGKIFGNRDHTTVIYAVNKVRDRSTKDRMFKELLDGLSSRLMTRSFRT
ncbi:MAG: chromosomal replication initiator protein [Planctomycetota bacterium]|jgi:chromosomal replication initiator protein